MTELPDPASPPPPEGLAEVWRGTSLSAANERVLVVLAMQLDCRLEHDPIDRALVIHADPAHAEAIRDEIHAYNREQSEQMVHRAIDLPRFPMGAWLTFLWAVGLLTMFYFQSSVPGLTEDLLSTNTAIIEDGQWWRTATALFLHADLGHLLGNIVFGVLFCSIVARSLGPLVGWLLIHAAGILGNLLTAWFYHPEPFSSLGASTAVFGALGILTGYGFLVAFRSPANAPWAQIILPAGGGLALLGWLGVGGRDTDVLGHLSGFFVGFPLGFLATWWRLRGRFSRIPT